MRYLRRFGDLLDVADEKTTESDLQTLTRQAGDVLGAAGGVLEAAADGAAKKVKQLDLGIVEGLNDLSNQIGTDLKDLDVRRLSQDDDLEASTDDLLAPGGEFQGESEQGAMVTTGEISSSRLAGLAHRVQEFEAREEEHFRSQVQLQKNIDQVETAIQDLRKDSTSGVEQSRYPSHPKEADSPSGGDVVLEAMRSEFCDLQAASKVRCDAMAQALLQASSSCEHLANELEFWKDKAERMLQALGQDHVPEEIELAIENDEEDDEPEMHIQHAPDQALVCADKSAAEQATKDLEISLADLMRHSDEVMERVEKEQQHERDLQAKLAAAKADASMKAAEVAVSKSMLESAKAAKASLELQHSEVQDFSSQRKEVPQLRAEVDTLRLHAEEVRQENAALEVRLQKHRAAAAADLERAVPLSSPTCWQCVDDPVMKLVMLLVRSTCLRRAFALHLMATYLWLVFLVFWLEKH